MKIPMALIGAIVLATAFAAAGASFAGHEYDFTRQRLFPGFDGRLCKVQPSVASDGRGTALLTFQKLLLTGSDVFYGQYVSRSEDGGKTWSEPVDQREFSYGQTERGRVSRYATVYYSPRNGRWFGLGQELLYEDDKTPVLKSDDGQVFGVPLYVSVDPEKGAYAGYRKLDFPFDYVMALPFGQFLDCDNGDVLVCFYYQEKGACAQFTKCVTVRYRFDGDSLKVVQAGTPVVLDGLARGFSEPSLARLGGRVYMTLRSDERGMFAESKDGLSFGEPIPWTWEDGTRIGNRNTQQHWIRGKDALYLAYTRETPWNAHVFRNRAPVFAAKFDPVRKCLLRETEFALVPELGTRSGNFCIADVADESWLVTAEWMQGVGGKLGMCERYGADNSIWLVRVRFGGMVGGHRNLLLAGETPPSAVVEMLPKVADALGCELGVSVATGGALPAGPPERGAWDYVGLRRPTADAAATRDADAVFRGRCAKALPRAEVVRAPLARALRRLSPPGASEAPPPARDYLESLVWAGMLFGTRIPDCSFAPGVRVRDCSFAPPSLGADEALRIRLIAQETVDEIQFADWRKKADHPVGLGPVPSLMTTFDGREVRDVATWEKVRKPELRQRFLERMYGVRPAAAERPEVSFAPVEPDRPMLDGMAVRRRVRISYRGPCGTNSFVVTAFVPKSTRPVPAFVLICGRDPKGNLDPERNRKSEFWPVERIVERGYAAIAFFSGDVAPETGNPATAFLAGVFPCFERPQERDDRSWGTLSAWAWGASRVMDWIRAEPSLDASRVAVVGHGRGGKASLLAGVTDERFALTCVNCSGCGGAKLAAADLPESEHYSVFLGSRATHWFCGNFQRYFMNRDRRIDRIDACKPSRAELAQPLDVDQHEWAALVAPRLLAIASATEDRGAGPFGEFCTARLASEAWRLYGREGLPAGDFPRPQRPMRGGDVGYHLRAGGHDLTRYDWDAYMDFADEHGWSVRKNLLMSGDAPPAAVVEMLPKVAAAMGRELAVAVEETKVPRDDSGAVASAFDWADVAKARILPEKPLSGLWDYVAMRRPFADFHAMRLAGAKFCLRYANALPKAEIVVVEPLDYAQHGGAYDFSMEKSLRVAPVGTAARLLDGGAVAHPDPNAPKYAYLESLVWVAKLFGVDVADCPYAPEALSADEAARIRRAAQDAVSGVAVPPEKGGVAIPAEVAAGMARLRSSGTPSCRVQEVEYSTNEGVRVFLLLKPSETSTIRCEVRLPDPAKWNGRFWGYGCGGWPEMRTDYFMGPSGAVEMKCDMGTLRYPIGAVPVHPDVRKDFGWRATHLATVEAKRLVRLFYGRDPAHSYFFGSSTGGRQAVGEARRFPADYDGVVAGVPALEPVAHAIPGWLHARLRRKYGTWFTPAQAAAISKAERAYFAKTDPEIACGRFINDPRQTPEKLDGCWKEALRLDPSIAGLEAMWRELFEPVYACGRRIPPCFVIGTEFVSCDEDFMLSSVFGAKKLADASEEEIAWMLDEPDYSMRDADLSEFAARGGRLITYAGLEDESVPALPVMEHWCRAVERMGRETVDGFFAHYLIPGRKHAPGVWARHGATGDPADIKRVIEDWVEKGVKPGVLTFPFLEEPGKSIRLAPYPSVGVVR